MNSHWRVNQSRYGKDTSSIRSTRGYILDNNQDIDININNNQTTKHMEEKTDFNLNIENKQYIAAGADVTGTSQKQSSLNDYTDVKNDQENTEKSLLRFQKQYNDLLKKKNETKPSECSTNEKVMETPSPAKLGSFESSCSCFSNDSNKLIRSNVNKCDEPANEDNGSVGCFDDGSPKYIEKKHDTYLTKKRNNNSFVKKNSSCKHNTNGNHVDDNYKFKKYNKNLRGRHNNDKRQYCAQEYNKKLLVTNQSHKTLVDHSKYYEMFESLNKDLKKVQNLFHTCTSKQQVSSPCNNYENTINQSKKMPAGEDSTDRDRVDKPTRQKSKSVQSFDDYQYNQYKNHNNDVEYYQDYIEF